MGLTATHVALAAFPDCANGPLQTNLVCNASADPFIRAKALVNALMPDDLVINIVNGTSGEPRLRLPAYN